MGTKPIRCGGMSGDMVTIAISPTCKDDLIKFLDFLLKAPPAATPMDIIQDAGVFPEDLENLINRIRMQETLEPLVLQKSDVLDINRLMSEYSWMGQPPERAGLDRDSFQVLRTNINSIYEQAFKKEHEAPRKS